MHVQDISVIIENTSIQGWNIHLQTDGFVLDGDENTNISKMNCSPTSFKMCKENNIKNESISLELNIQAEFQQNPFYFQVCLFDYKFHH